MERMKNGLVIWLLLLAATCVQAQSDLVLMMNKEGKLIAIPKRMSYELNIPEFSYKSYTPANTLALDKRLREFMPDLPPGIDERPMDMQVLSAAYQPFFNVFTPMIRRVSPMAMDFNEVSITPVSDHVDFLVNGQQYTWPGAGGITRITTALVWRNDNWTVSGGAFAGRFYTPFNSSPGFMGGAHAEVGYQATDWLKLRTWGQYAGYGKEKENPHMLMNPFYNHTSVGSGLELKLNDNFGVGMGVNFEYNPMKRKMEPQYMVYPIFFR